MNVLSGQNIATAAAIPAMPLRTITRIRLARLMLFDGRAASSPTGCVNGIGSRRAAPQFLQKMSPSSAGASHLGQRLAVTTFREASSIKDVFYASQYSSVVIRPLHELSKTSHLWIPRNHPSLMRLAPTSIRAAISAPACRRSRCRSSWLVRPALAPECGLRLSIVL